jgi:7-alpha-hydroxysteroid dehydrogenase
MTEALVLDPACEDAAEVVWRTLKLRQAGRPEPAPLDNATEERVKALLARAAPDAPMTQARNALAELALIAPDDARLVELLRERSTRGALMPTIIQREQRRGLRLPLNVSGRDARGAPFADRAQTVNISGGGLCFEAVRRLPVGSRIDLRIPVPPALRRHFGGRSTYAVKAVVCRLEAIEGGPPIGSARGSWGARGLGAEDADIIHKFGRFPATAWSSPGSRGRSPSSPAGARALGGRWCSRSRSAAPTWPSRSTTSARGAEEAAAAVRGSGRRVWTRAADARRPGEIGGFVERAAAEMGGLDLLVNNVGVFRKVPLAELTEDVLDEAFAVNVKAAVMASRAAAPHMRRRGGGSIVNVASLGGLRPWPSYVALLRDQGGAGHGHAVPGPGPGPGDPGERGRAGHHRAAGRGRDGEREDPAAALRHAGGSGRDGAFPGRGSGYTTGEVIRVDGGRALR